MVIDIDPRNTSKTCSNCGHCSKSNRKTQSEFLCVSCGFSANADTNAALNISAKGWGVLSIAHTDRALTDVLGQINVVPSPRALAVGI